MKPKQENTRAALQCWKWWLKKSGEKKKTNTQTQTHTLSKRAWWMYLSINIQVFSGTESAFWTKTWRWTKGRISSLLFGVMQHYSFSSRDFSAAFKRYWLLYYMLFRLPCVLLVLYITVRVLDALDQPFHCVWVSCLLNIHDYIIRIRYMTGNEHKTGSLEFLKRYPFPKVDLTFGGVQH